MIDPLFDDDGRIWIADALVDPGEVTIHESFSRTPSDDDADPTTVWHVELRAADASRVLGAHIDAPRPELARLQRRASGVQMMPAEALAETILRLEVAGARNAPAHR